MRVHNDIAMALDHWKSVILLLLDLSATFNAVDHYGRLCVVHKRVDEKMWMADEKIHQMLQPESRYGR